MGIIALAFALPAASLRATAAEPVQASLIRPDLDASAAKRNSGNNGDKLCLRLCRHRSGTTSQLKCFCECSGGIWHPSSRHCE
jgi:hypothetical protein